jgi:hypothetical protein
MVELADFDARIFEESLGAVLAGSYVATIFHRSSRPTSGMTVKQIEALEKVLIKYCTNTSDLKVDAKPGKNTIDLKLSSAN